MEIIFAVVISIGSIMLAAWMIYTVLSLAPWLPTRSTDYERIGVAAQIQKGDVFYDLGSGDGRVICALAQKCPDAQFVGIEMSFLLHVIACMRMALVGVTNVRCIRGNIFTQSYAGASIIYIFGTDRTINSQRMKDLLDGLPSQTRVILYNFTYAAWAESRIVHEKKGNTTLNIYHTK